MMLKMLIIVFILLEIFSFAKSGHEEISHDGYADILDNLASNTINAQDSLSSLQFQPSILDFLQRYTFLSLHIPLLLSSLLIIVEREIDMRVQEIFFIAYKFGAKM